MPRFVVHEHHATHLHYAVDIYWLKEDTYTMAMHYTGIKAKYYSIFCGMITAIILFFSPSHAIDKEASVTYEQELLRCINKHRIEKGMASLSSDITLDKIAKIHSQHMNNENELNHADFDDRFEQSRRSVCVENVGWNYKTPETQFKAWKNSGGHNKNMLNAKIKRAGISKVGSYVTFFACD